MLPRTHTLTRWTAVLAVAAALWVPQGAAAQDGQFYFVAKVDSQGSISSTAGTQRGIYLRWDLVSGFLPAGLQQFVIHRHDQPNLVALPVLPQQDANQILALYPVGSRLRAQVVDWLTEEAANTPGALPVDDSNFQHALAAKLNPLDPDLPWLHLGSRIDFALARARHRGFLDTSAPPGQVEYELVGDYGGGNEVRLGHVVIQNGPPHVMPEPDALAQVRLGRCDAPERSKDHGALALNWSHPGEAVDELRSSLLIAGYDVHCALATMDPTDPVPPRNLRAEAAPLAHQADGSVAFTGLQRLNDQPVVVSGTGETFERTQGYQEALAQIQFSPEEVAALGMQPGDSHACYVTAIDVSSNYGETAGIVVTIPDRDAPPAPWAIEVLTDTPNQTLKLWWDHVDVVNYERKHRDGRSFCNLETAEVDRELYFVSGDADRCEDSPQLRTPLDVARYHVYRFDDWNDAKRFRDSDGDGYGDAWEQVLASAPGVPNPGVPVCAGLGDQACLTLPGTACDASAVPANPAADFKIFSFDAQTHLVHRPSGRRVIELSDAVPAGEPGKVFWYVVLAEEQNGNFSRPSAPIRAFFPDRTRPISDEFDRCPLGEPYCGAVAQPSAVPEPFATDATTAKRARFANVQCGATTLLVPIDPVTHSGGLPDATCQVLDPQCSVMNVTYMEADLTPIDSVSLIFAGCDPAPASILVDDVDRLGNCQDPRVDPIDPGEQPSSALDLGCELPEGQCVTIYRRVDGEPRRLKTICPPADPICIDGFLIVEDGQLVEASCDPGTTRVPVPNLGGEPLCLSYAIVNENNIPSPQVHLPCFPTATPKPGIPTPLDVVFPGDADPSRVRARFSWLPPEGRLIGTSLSLRVGGLADGPVFEELFAEHANASANDGPRELEVDIDVPDPVGDEEQRWCFRVRAVGHAPPLESERALSDPSQELCVQLGPAGPETPEYLGWPEVPLPPEHDALDAYYLPYDGIGVVRLAPLTACVHIPECPRETIGVQSFPVCFDGSVPQGLPPTGLDDPRGTAVTTFPECINPCDEIAVDLSGELSFVAYRQEREGPGLPESEFVQVSPLVDHYDCRPPVMNDPLIKPLWLDEAAPFDDPALYWLDRFPHTAGRELRYQFVYFDANGEIVRYRTSNWVVVQ